MLIPFFIMYLLKKFIDFCLFPCYKYSIKRRKEKFNIKKAIKIMI